MKTAREAFIQQWADEIFELENNRGRWRMKSRKAFIRALLDAYDARPNIDGTGGGRE